jgi:hypothetical protein
MCEEKKSIVNRKKNNGQKKKDRYLSARQIED